MMHGLGGNRIPLERLRPYDADAMYADCVDPGTTVTAQEATLIDSL